jgi:hypothetical protein
MQIELTAPGLPPLIVEANETTKEWYVRGKKDDGNPSNVAIYIKEQGGGVVFNRGEIDAELQGNPFLLDGDNRITNIGV